MKTHELVEKFNELSIFLAYDEFIYLLSEDVVNDLITSPWGMVLTIKFGEVNLSHDYFTFDGNGNMKTLSDNDIKEMLSKIISDNSLYLVNNFDEDIHKYLS